jgi:hypothetical protein
VTLVKADEDLMPSNVIASSALATEDEFEDLYGVEDADNTKPHILRPPFPIDTLYRLVQENNALGQAITAY